MKTKFEDKIITMKQASYDKTNKEYLSNSNIEVYDFDKIKDSFASSLNRGGATSPLSNDVLYCYEDRIYFIEFKNGRNINPHNLSRKNYDSTIILSKILDVSLNELCDKLCYILVYNSQYHQEESVVEQSTNRDKLGKKFSGLANKKFIKFNQGFFLNYIFSSVETLTEKEFQEEYVNNWEQE